MFIVNGVSGASLHCINFGMATEAFVGSGNKMMPLSEKDRRIKELEEELRETRRANDILKEALGFFAQSRKK